jgi:glycosyltransferase involved in cell wall biosynthesis
MIVLFLHQNGPGQYAHLVRDLAADPAHCVILLTQNPGPPLAGVQTLVYAPEAPLGGGHHPYNATYESAVRTGLAVMHACRSLRAAGTRPDLVVGHSGWGETLLVKEVYPDVPVLAYFEFYYHARGADVGFDPEFAPAREEDGVRLRLRNAVNWMSFAGSDWGHTATAWQRRLFPAPIRARLTALHEGIDTRAIAPDPDARLELPGTGRALTRADEVLTFVARNLEPYRGFHWFMRALPELQRRRPRLQVVVVGGDGVSYGDAPPYGGSYREMLLAELGGRLDRERVHFLGQVPRQTYLQVLQVSAVHAYFTYPFVLSWSLLEAMAAGCLVVGSAHAPVSDVLQDGINGLAVDAFDAQAVADGIGAALDRPDRLQPLRDAARATVVRDFDLHERILPLWRSLLADVAARRTPCIGPVD